MCNSPVGTPFILYHHSPMLYLYTDAVMRDLMVDSQRHSHIIQIKCSPTIEVTEPPQWHMHSLSWYTAKPLFGKCLLYLIIHMDTNHMQISYNWGKSSLKNLLHNYTKGHKTHNITTRQEGQAALYDDAEGTSNPPEIAVLCTTPSSNSKVNLDGGTSSEYNEKTVTQRDLTQLQEHFTWFKEQLNQLGTAENTPVHTEECYVRQAVFCFTCLRDKCVLHTKCINTAHTQYMSSGSLNLVV